MNQFNDSCPPDSRLAVELADMLNARERRVCTQRELLSRCPLYQALWVAHIGAQTWAVTSGEKEGN